MSFEEKEMKAVEMSLDAEPLKAANDQLNVSGLVLLRGLCLYCDSTTISSQNAL